MAHNYFAKAEETEMKISSTIKTPTNLEAMRRKRDENIYRQCKVCKAWQQLPAIWGIDSWHPADMLDGHKEIYRAIGFEPKVAEVIACPDCNGGRDES